MYNIINNKWSEHYYLNVKENNDIEKRLDKATLLLWQHLYSEIDENCAQYKGLSEEVYQSFIEFTEVCFPSFSFDIHKYKKIQYPNVELYKQPIINKILGNVPLTPLPIIKEEDKNEVIVKKDDKIIEAVVISDLVTKPKEIKDQSTQTDIIDNQPIKEQTPLIENQTSPLHKNLILKFMKQMNSPHLKIQINNPISPPNSPLLQVLVKNNITPTTSPIVKIHIS